MNNKFEVSIDYYDRAPVYRQIYMQFKNGIEIGFLKTDEALPSIRKLSDLLDVSVIVVKRAYTKLKQDGFIYTVKGKGCFVAKQYFEKLFDEKMKKIKEHIKEVIVLSDMCGMSRKELIQALKLYLDNDKIK